MTQNTSAEEDGRTIVREAFQIMLLGERLLCCTVRQLEKEGGQK